MAANVVEVIFRGIDEVSANVEKITKSLLTMGQAIVANFASAAAEEFLHKMVEIGKATIEAADRMQEYGQVIKQVTKSQTEFVAVQNALLDVALQSDTAYTSTVELYARLQAQTERLGFSDNQLLHVVQAVNEAQRLAGPLAGDVAQQFARLAAQGEVSGLTLVQLFTRAPVLMEALSAQLNKTPQELGAMARAGELSMSTIFDAIEKQSDKINEKFEQSGTTLHEAIVDLGTGMLAVIGAVNDKLGVTDTLAKGIKSTAEDLRELSKNPVASGGALSAAAAAIGFPLVGAAIGIGSAAAKHDENSKKFVGPLQDPLDQASEAQDSFSEKAQVAIEALQRQAAVLGKTKEEAVLYKLAMEGAGEEQLKLANDALQSTRAFNEALETTKNNTGAVIDELLREVNQGAAESKEQIGAVIENLLREVNQGTEDSKQQFSAMVDELMREVKEMDDAETTVNETLSAIANKKAEDAAKRVSIAWDQALRNIQSTIADTLIHGFDNGVKGVLSSFAKLIQQIVAQAAAAKITEALFGTPSTGGSAGTVGLLGAGLKALLGTGKASGGWTQSGMIYPVNEQGPELLISGDRSRVVPLGRAAANGINVGNKGNVMINNPVTITTTVSPAELQSILRQNNDMLIAKIRRQQSDGDWS